MHVYDYVVITEGSFPLMRITLLEAIKTPYLECTVSILTDCEVETSCLDWEEGNHGIDIDSNDLENTICRTTYFLGIIVEEAWRKMETVDSLVVKS